MSRTRQKHTRNKIIQHSIHNAYDARVWWWQAVRLSELPVFARAHTQHTRLCLCACVFGCMPARVCVCGSSHCDVVSLKHVIIILSRVCVFLALFVCVWVRRVVYTIHFPVRRARRCVCVHVCLRSAIIHYAHAWSHICANLLKYIFVCAAYLIESSAALCAE